MKAKPFEIIVEFTPQSTKTGITYEAHKKGSLIRCKDCKYGVYETYGEYGHYCSLDRYVETGEEFCSSAEPKEDS